MARVRSASEKLTCWEFINRPDAVEAAGINVDEVV